jgi:DNA-binding NtrC family response regulator
VPPLRDRLEDVPALAEHLVTEIATRIGRPAPELAAGALECLRAYPYPGNVRELANILERALVRCRSPRLGAEHLDPGLRAAPVARAAPRADLHPGDGLPPGLPIELEALERLAITEALRRVGGNRTHAARLLGISLRTLRNKLRAWRAQAALSADGQSLPGEEEGESGGAEADGLARASQEESAA